MKYSLELLVALQRIQLALDIYDFRNERRSVFYKRDEKHDTAVNDVKGEIKKVFANSDTTTEDQSIILKCTSIKTTESKNGYSSTEFSLQKATEDFGGDFTKSEFNRIDELLSYQEGRTAVTVLDTLTHEKTMKNCMAQECKSKILTGNEEDFDQRIAEQLKSIDSLIGHLKEIRSKFQPIGSGIRPRQSELYAILNNAIEELTDAKGALNKAVAENEKRKSKEQKEKHQKEINLIRENHEKEKKELVEDKDKKINSLEGRVKELVQSNENLMNENKKLQEVTKQKEDLQNKVQNQEGGIKKLTTVAASAQSVALELVQKDAETNGRLQVENAKLEEKIKKLEIENKAKDEVIQSLMDQTKQMIQIVIDAAKNIISLFVQGKDKDANDEFENLTYDKVEKLSLESKQVIAQVEDIAKEKKSSPSSSPKSSPKSEDSVGARIKGVFGRFFQAQKPNTSNGDTNQEKPTQK